MASSRVNCTSATEARIVSVRSVTTVSRTPAGSERSSCGSAARMSATVCTMLAPGWRWMSRMTAGWPFSADCTRLFSTAGHHRADVAQAQRGGVLVADDELR